MIKKVNKNKFGVIEYLIEDMEDLKNLPKKDTDNTAYAIMRKGNEKLIYLYSSSTKEWILISEDLSSIKSSLEDMASDIEELKQGDIETDLTDYAKKSDLEVKVDKVNGKSLILDSEITRLATVKNYDDTKIKNTLNNKANVSDLHSHTNKTVLDGITSTKVNEWNNKSTFDGNYNSLTNKPTIPSLNGYATEQYVNEEIEKIDVTEQLTDYAKKSELHSHSNKTVLDGISSTKVTEWNKKSNFSGNYNDLTNKPTIPTKTSQLTNDSEYITEHQDLSNYPMTSELTLGVHTDGLIYLFKGNQPIGNGVAQTIQSGDVVGYVDSDNDIVLSGKLADGTYKLKYEMEDGSKIDVGQIDLSDKPTDTN